MVRGQRSKLDWHGILSVVGAIRDPGEIARTDEQRKPVCPERTGEDDQQESERKDERQEDDSLKEKFSERSELTGAVIAYFGVQLPWLSGVEGEKKEEHLNLSRPGRRCASIHYATISHGGPTRTHKWVTNK